MNKEITSKKTTTKATTKTCKRKTTTCKSEKTKTKPLPKISIENKKKIVFIGSEAAPFIATGGLADVLGSLPKALASTNRYDVSVILPMYSSINCEYRAKFKFLTNFNVSVAWRWQYAGVFYYQHEGVNFYFIDKKHFFGDNV